MDSYEVAVVNESTADENAKGRHQNPVSSTCSLSGHCSTSTTDFSYYDHEIIVEPATEKRIADERETNGAATNGDAAKKVAEDSSECQRASISCAPSNDEIPVSTSSTAQSRTPSHLHVLKKSCQMKVENLRLNWLRYLLDLMLSPG